MIALPRAFLKPTASDDKRRDYAGIGITARLSCSFSFLTIREAISKRYPSEKPSVHVEERIYDGFPSRADELLMQRFHQTPWEQRTEILDKIEDQRIRELGYRLIYGEKPAALSAEKKAELDEWCDQRLKPNTEVPWLTVAGALDETEKLLAAKEVENKEFVVEVKEWLQQMHGR